MRRLGVPIVRPTRTVRGTAATLVTLAVLLAGCGGSDGDAPQGDDGPSPSSATAPPSEEATPSELEGGTTVEGPAFTFTVAPNYELHNQDDGEGAMGEWLRSYALDTFTAFSVGYFASEHLPLQEQLATARNYLTGRGTHRIERADDLTLLGHDTAHLIGRDDNAEIHVYVVQLDRHYLEISVERKPGDAEQKRIQQAMIDSIRLTEQSE